MNVRRYIAIVTFVLGVCGTSAYAQEEGFTKQIEVQKEYEVVVRSAERIEQEVALLDTVIVRPELSYRITPTAHITHFATSPLKPMEISTAEWVVPHKFYINVGGGLPLQSEADLYWTPIDNGIGRLQLWLNHEGREGKTSTFEGDERVKGMTLRNMAGVKYDTRIGSRTHLSAEVKYRGTLGDSYGGVGAIAERLFVSVNDVEARVKLLGDFGNSSPLAYEANAMGLRAWNNSAEHVGRFNFNFGLLGLNNVKGWLPPRVTLHWSGVQSVCAEPYFDTSITFIPEWSLRIGKWVAVDLVAGYDHMIYKGAKNSLDGLILTLDVAFDKYRFATPYLTLVNDVETQVTRTGLWENPYMAMLPLDTRKIYLAEVGVKGNAGSWGYKLSGAVRQFSSYLFEVIDEGSSLLSYGSSTNQTVWYADAEATWRPSERLCVEVDAEYITLGSATGSTAYYSPRKWKVGGNVCWQPLGSLRFTARCEWRSAMEVAVRSASAWSVVEMPSYCDLGVEAEWLVDEGVALWLRGDNLLNQPIYHWATYRALGAGFRLGASVRF